MPQTASKLCAKILGLDRAVDGHDIQGRVQTSIKVHGIQEGMGLQTRERMKAASKANDGDTLGSVAGTLVSAGAATVLVLESKCRGVLTKALGEALDVPVRECTRRSGLEAG